MSLRDTPSPSRLLTPADVGAWVELVYYCGNTFAGTLRAYTDSAAHLTGDDGREKRVLLDGLQAAIVGRESGGAA